MNTTQDILNLFLAVGFLVVTVCVVYITYYLVKALRSITNLTDSLKSLAVIPALVVALVSRIFKKRG